MAMSVYRRVPHYLKSASGNGPHQLMISHLLQMAMCLVAGRRNGFWRSGRNSQMEQAIYIIILLYCMYIYIYIQYILHYMTILFGMAWFYQMSFISVWGLLLMTTNSANNMYNGHRFHTANKERTAEAQTGCACRMIQLSYCFISCFFPILVFN